MGEVMSEPTKPKFDGPGVLARVLESASNTRKPKTALGYPFAMGELFFNAFRGAIGFPKKAPKR
jgi:hypothetical protein